MTKRKTKMVAKTIELPNVKKLYLPDVGYYIGDFDLKQADAQVVAWEAHDDYLKTVFRKKFDLHLANAEIIFNLGINLDDLADPVLVDKLKHDYKHERDMAKRGVHLTNYLGGVSVCAKALGITRKAADDFQSRWFGEHPGIVDWHQRTEASLYKSRSVSNVFGYKRQYFDRIESCLSQALGWIPQSTVALIISKAMITLDENHSDIIQLLMQVHDSVIHQFLYKNRAKALIATRKAMEIVTPYDDPLIIPSDAAISKLSWGHVEDINWPEVTSCNKLN